MSMDADALAREILASAALVEDDGETIEPAEQNATLAAAQTVEVALREVFGHVATTAQPTHVAPSSEPVADSAWFAKWPRRTARLRPRQANEALPYWATEGEPLFTLVRCLGSRLSCEVVPVGEASAADDSDEAVLAIVRAARASRA